MQIFFQNYASKNCKLCKNYASYHNVTEQTKNPHFSDKNKLSLLYKEAHAPWKTKLFAKCNGLSRFRDMNHINFNKNGCGHSMKK